VTVKHEDLIETAPFRLLLDGAADAHADADECLDLCRATWVSGLLQPRRKAGKRTEFLELSRRSASNLTVLGLKRITVVLPPKENLPRSSPRLTSSPSNLCIVIPATIIAPTQLRMLGRERRTGSRRKRQGELTHTFITSPKMGLSMLATRRTFSL